ncbi:MAG: diguanylate cyclase [Candidatus Solibacter usitatus]|nr:diguanylate cyclase [Candidatus Solibacter usitatus]
MEILIAEDNPVFQRILDNMVRKWDYQPILVPDGTQAWEILQRDNPPRLAIMDWMMPGLSGIELCRRLREQPREPYIYVLLLSAKNSRDELVEGMEAGADDYLGKPVDSHELRVRLRAGERIVKLQAELLEARDAMRQQSLHDSLTGVWNRAAIFDFLKRELARGQRESTPVSVVMIDLDHFKLVNDQFGHLAGDEVLIEAARRMTATIRPYDAVGRYGGEEFLIVMANSDSHAAAERADQIRKAIAGSSFLRDRAAVDVTCSLGVYSTHGGALITPEALLEEADAALYLAKRNGRNRFEVGEPQGEPSRNPEVVLA